MKRHSGTSLKKNVSNRTKSFTGYSGTPLIKKLGIQEGFSAVIINAPAGYLNDLGELPRNLILTVKLNHKADFIHFFTKSKVELIKKFPLFKKFLKPDGMLWISWPKKLSKIQTDLTEDIIRGIAIENGIVDVKVCAIDQTWSALKLVYRLKDR